MLMRNLWKRARSSHHSKQKIIIRFRSRYGHFERLEPRAMLAGHGDFNGDGRDDLAIAAKGERVGDVALAGAVHVVYGGRKGLSATGNQTWTRSSSGVDGVAATNEGFGGALAIGDFNGDGFDDLAIGVPQSTVGGIAQAGGVNVLYGSRDGLTAKNDQLWTQDSAGINDMAEGGDQFGSALSTGDFNNDGRDELVIGVRYESVGTISTAGAVNVIYGSASGLTSSGDQLWSQNSSGINDTSETSDLFGAALATGDLNGDGRDDLAIGVSGEVVGTINDAGAVNVIYGSASGLTGSGDQFWTQDSPGIEDDAEASDLFGSALAAGDFNGDDFDDLAIGVHKETVELRDRAGLVNVLYGSAVKLTAAGNYRLWAPRIGYTSQVEAFFGYTLAAGDFNGDGQDDLAIGALTEDIGAVADAGAVYVVYGSADGAFSTGAQRWVQGAGPAGTLPDSPEAMDYFSSALAAGDFDGDGHDDLAIGVPGENDNASHTDSGMVQVLYGFFVSGLFVNGNSIWHNGFLSSSSGVHSFDYFGSALA